MTADRKASTTTIDEANEKTMNGTVLPFHFDYPITHIVLDFSSIPFVDSVGCKVLKQVGYLCRLCHVYISTENDT